MTGALVERDEASPRRVSSNFAADQLKTIVARIERLEEEKAGLASDIRDIFAEARGNGYDVKTLRKVIKLRTMDAAERDEAEHLLDTYCVALGMKPQMELFDGEREWKLDRFPFFSARASRDRSTSLRGTGRARSPGGGLSAALRSIAPRT